MKIRSFAPALACAGLALVFALGSAAGLFAKKTLAQKPAQSAASSAPAAFLDGPAGGPRFVIDPWWPKPYPDRWVTARIGGICIDRNDHVFLFTRRDLLPNDKEAGVASPVIMEMDQDGNVVNHWGDPDNVPVTAHGCTVDYENNVWLTGDQDGMIQKYSHDGRLLLTIGAKGKRDSSDGTLTGTGLNSSKTGFFGASQVAVDPANGDVYVSDGVGNRRVIVFDRTGKFLRQWGRQGTKEEVSAGMGGVFMTQVHSIVLANDGLLYVTDRYGNRIEVFDKMGNFKRNIWVRSEGLPVPDPSGTALFVAFSPDPAQKYMYVTDEHYDTVDIFDHATDKFIGSFGRVGHQVGNLEHPHQLAVDSKGNIYICEEEWGRRTDRFLFVSDRK